jgi:hypothetical protein
MSYIKVLLAALVGIGSSFSQPSATLVVKVRDVKVTSSPDNGTPDMKHDVFYANFQASFRNTSDHPTFVSSEPLIPRMPEILLPSGEWASMMPSLSVYETGHEEHQQCTKVEPGKTFTFPNVNGLIILKKDRPANHTATVRFNFYNVCMIGSVRRSTEFVTESIHINH